jgi:hypothetical protein
MDRMEAKGRQRDGSSEAGNSVRAFPFDGPRKPFEPTQITQELIVRDRSSSRISPRCCGGSKGLASVGPDRQLTEQVNRVAQRVCSHWIHPRSLGRHGEFRWTDEHSNSDLPSPLVTQQSSRPQISFIGSQDGPEGSIMLNIDYVTLFTSSSSPSCLYPCPINELAGRMRAVNGHDDQSLNFCPRIDQTPNFCSIIDQG